MDMSSTLDISGDFQHRPQAGSRLVNFAMDELSVHPLQHALGDAADLPHPDRTAEDDNVVRQYLLSQRRARVAIAFIRRDAGLDV